MKKGLMLFLCICVLVGTASYFVMLFLFTDNKDNMPNASAKPIEQSPDNTATPALYEDKPKIKPYTKMVYQYYYPEDDITKQEDDVPPYYMLDMTLDDMKDVYTDWKVVSFSDAEVVMRRDMQGKSDERYIISQKDGYIAVYYEEAQNGISLHEITQTPVSSLPIEEQDRIRAGINVYGNDNLCKVLADYGS